MDPLKVGHVIGVTGDTVDVQICVADLRLNYHGTTYRVGRLGTYVTLPLERITLIGYVVGVGATGELEPGPDPGRPRRITMNVQLLGTIRNDKFTRGVNEYPTLGDPVRLAVDEDFELIFGCFDDLAKGGDHRKAFPLGRFAVDTDFEVKVLGKEFFAKHVAIMGNSGSGKSCTTAKILHEALRLPHAQIVLFDMHGEYLAAFSDDDGNPNPNVTYLSDRNLVLPYWMLHYEEFEQLFVDTNNTLNLNAQKVFLRSAFEKLKYPAAEELDLLCEYSIDTPVYYSIENLKTYAENMNEARFVLNSENYAFARLPHRTLPLEEQEQMLLSRRMEFNKGNPEGEIEHATYHGRLLGLVNLLETRLKDRRYDFLLHPFEQAAKNPDLAGHLQPDMSPGELSRAVALVIRQMLGRLGKRKNLTIVDLSGLPFDVVDITVAVLTRTLFDFNFWSPPDIRQPIVLVFEEAHNYLPRKLEKGRTFARDAVEKVAKEGRKYGVSAMIVSQRPSEISETILSQCNSMILMRMNNPDDQDYAGRVVSDQFRSLINLLPSMKPGEGFVIGDSVLMPMRTLIDLPPKLPRSGDVDFFDLWSKGVEHGEVETIIDRWWRQDRSATGKKVEMPSAAGGDPEPARPAPHAPVQRGVPRSKPSTRAPERADKRPLAPPPKRQQTMSAAERRLAELSALLSGPKKH
ncbi:MAG: ATP-binding protein [Planctomycetes bacterium]|nr:ATP-binding protein [Planctomycetota bacterium]